MLLGTCVTTLERQPGRHADGGGREGGANTGKGVDNIADSGCAGSKGSITADREGPLGLNGGVIIRALPRRRFRRIRSLLLRSAR